MKKRCILLTVLYIALLCVGCGKTGDASGDEALREVWLPLYTGDGPEGGVHNDEGADRDTDNTGTAGVSDNTVSDETDERNEAVTENSFYAESIPDDVFEKMQGKSYKTDCNIPREDLRYLHVLHKTLEGETLEGELICHEIIADDLLEIFKELYLNDYPIEKIRLVDEYDADDERSMSDNNSSCFNYRTISYSDTISKHGLGVAVDINPLYNPYTKTVNGNRSVEPANGEFYLDRDADFPYKIDENDLCYKLFIEHGFKWGGAWTNSKDYQHFELPDSVTDELQEKYK